MTGESRSAPSGGGIRRRFLRLGEPGGPAEVWRPRQVHGAEVVVLESPRTPRSDADGVVTCRPGLAIGVVTADCVPILLAARGERPAVGAVHAGWRGLAAGVIERALAELARLSKGPVDALIGPAAGICCYEVGPEVIAAVEPGGHRTAPSPAGRTLLDLQGVATDRLVAAGIPAERVEGASECTVCSDRWPSYRREGVAAGRILGVTDLNDACSSDTPSP